MRTPCLRIGRRCGGAQKVRSAQTRIVWGCVHHYHLRPVSVRVVSRVLVRRWQRMKAQATRLVV